jgi:hypothetical protein
MITDAQFAAWLGDSTALRVMLFEAGASSAGASVTRYLSNRPYNGAPATPYQAIVAGGLTVTESISMNADATLAAGDIEIYNVAGERDAWLDDIWKNYPVKVYVGDVRWDRSDFRMVFAGIIIDIGSKSRDRLNLKLANKLEQLNTPVTDVKVGGNATNPDALVPMLLGECTNISPVLTNPNTLEFAFSSPGSEGVIEVRTDGKPRSAVTITPATGRFVFTEAVGTGQVTCSAQGVKYNGTYLNTIAQLVQYLATQCGKASTRFTTADLDTAQLAAFDAAHPQPVGLPLFERTNVLVAIQQLASSIGAQPVMSMLGQLRLVQFAIPSSATINIPRSQQLDSSITIVGRTEVTAAVKLGYCRNWTEQDSLQTSLPAAHKNLYAQEWLSVTVVDAAVQAAYKLDAEPDLTETCLLRKIDAQPEAERRRDIIKVPRTTYRFEAPPVQLLTPLGAGVNLFSNRFGLAAGKVGLVTSRAVNWGTLHITMEVTV